MNRPTINGTASGSIAPPQQRVNDTSNAAGNGGPSGGMSNQNLNGIVRDSYLLDSLNLVVRIKLIKSKPKIKFQVLVILL